jgi:Uma2 family endonuclease
MSAVQQQMLISVEDYLARELESPVKHEYLAGVVYAMAGAKNVHNKIATNVSGLLHARLRKKPCQPYNSDTKIRIRLPTQVRFYYPDASVICQSNPGNELFQDQPLILFEVVSPTTRRIDHGEKKDAYLSIPSLAVYVLVEQDSAMVILHRRTDQGFVREVSVGLEASISLPEIDTELPLLEIYEGVDFTPEPPEDSAG